MMSMQEMTKAILDSGLRESDLAKRVGTSQPTINRIKNGEIKNPGWAISKQIEGIYLGLDTEAA